MASLMRTLLLLLVCNSLTAGELRSIGTLYFSGTDPLCEKLTHLAEKVSPEAKALPVMANLALAFNPEYVSFDFTSPVHVFYYAVRDPKVKVPAPTWVMSVRRAGDRKLPATVKLFGQRAAVREHGDRALLSWNKEVLEQVNTLPEMPAPTHDIELRFRIAEYLRLMPEDYRMLKRYLLDNYLYKALGKSHNAVTASSLDLKTRYLDDVLNQTEELICGVSAGADRALADIRLVPVKDSAFARFVEFQRSNDRPTPPLIDGKDIALSMNFKPYAPAREGMAEMFAELEAAGGLEKEHAAYSKMIAAAFAVWDGRLSSFYDGYGVNSQRGFSHMRTEGDVAALDALLAQQFQAVKPGLYRIFAVQSLEDEDRSRKLFCLRRDDSILFAEGNYSGTEALAAIETGCKASTVPVPDKSPFFARMRADDTEGAEASLAFDNAGVSCHMVVFPPMLRRLVPKQENIGIKDRIRMQIDVKDLKKLR